MFDDQKSRLLAALDVLHSKYSQAEESDWPSLYFHLRISKRDALRTFNNLQNVPTRCWFHGK